MTDFNTANFTLWLVGAGVILLIGLLIVAWYYLRGILYGISSISQNTKVFSDSAKSLSLDMKALTNDIGTLSQDIRSSSQSSGELDQDIKNLTQNLSIFTQNVDNLTTSVNGLVASQNKMNETMETVQKLEGDAAKSIERVSKHFAE